MPVFEEIAQPKGCARSTNGTRTNQPPRVSNINNVSMLGVDDNRMMLSAIGSNNSDPRIALKQQVETPQIHFTTIITKHGMQVIQSLCCRFDERSDAFDISDSRQQFVFRYFNAGIAQ